jgi:hypothetical protein
MYIRIYLPLAALSWRPYVRNQKLVARNFRRDFVEKLSRCRLDELAKKPIPLAVHKARQLDWSIPTNFAKPMHCCQHDGGRTPLQTPNSGRLQIPERLRAIYIMQISAQLSIQSNQILDF